MSEDRERRGNPYVPLGSRPNLIALVLWAVTALLVTALLLRFALRAFDVRDDIPFASIVYAATGPLVEPFYRFFPASERFDYHTLEVASLAAAGAALSLAVGLYVLALVLVVVGQRLSREREPR